MAQKYYYAIVDKHNGSFLKNGKKDNEELSIYRSKKKAEADLFFSGSSRHIIQPVDIKKLNALVLSLPNKKAK